MFIAVVRKLLEYCYTEKELYWLDNLYPTEKDDSKASFFSYSLVLLIFFNDHVTFGRIAN